MSLKYLKKLETNEATKLILEECAKELKVDINKDSTEQIIYENFEKTLSKIEKKQKVKIIDFLIEQRFTIFGSKDLVIKSNDFSFKFLSYKKQIEYILKTKETEKIMSLSVSKRVLDRLPHAEFRIFAMSTNQIANDKELLKGKEKNFIHLFKTKIEHYKRTKKLNYRNVNFLFNYFEDFNKIQSSDPKLYKKMIDTLLLSVDINFYNKTRPDSLLKTIKNIQKKHSRQLNM